MKVRDLIERLQAADPDAEVRTMSQESWPFENAIRGTWEATPGTCNQCGQPTDDPIHDLDREDADHEADTFQPHDDFTEDHDGPVIYLVEGRQEGYGAREAWEAIW